MMPVGLSITRLRGAMAVFTPCGHRTDTAMPSSPWVMAKNSKFDGRRLGDGVGARA